MGDPVQLLYMALASPHGIAIYTDNLDRALQRLYTARRKAHDPSLSILQFRRSPTRPDCEIWVTKFGASPAPARDSVAMEEGSLAPDSILALMEPGTVPVRPTPSKEAKE